MHRALTRGLSLFLIFSVFFTFSASPALAAVTYTYDANGNMTSDGEDCYHYNEANQMDKVTKCASGETIAEYVYDYTGMRLVKKEFENGVLKKTIYSPADEYETVKQASNGATANTTYYKVNDELIAKKNPDGSITYYHNDHLGSSAVLSDETGAVVEKTSYEPYGEVKSGGTKSKFGYTGQEQDNETGLNYYNARYYDPHIQRFIQPDTLLPDIFDPQQLNRYSYANNNPLKYTDPTGHCVKVGGSFLGSLFATAVSCASTVSTVVRAGFLKLAAKPQYLESGAILLDSSIQSSQQFKTGDSLGGAQTLGFALLGLGGSKVGGGSSNTFASKTQVKQNSSGGKPGGSPQQQTNEKSTSVRQFGNIGGGKTTSGQALATAEKWLGKDYIELDSGVFRSIDEKRQFRISDNCLTGNQCHVHFQSVKPNKKDFYETSHVDITDP